jgi:hypothetical protein
MYLITSRYTLSIAQIYLKILPKCYHEINDKIIWLHLLDITWHVINKIKFLVGSII